MKRWLAWTLVLTILIGMFVFREWIISREGFDPIRAMDQDYGWLIFHRERVPRMEADQLIAADGMLFLHYEKYGYVNVYSADGTFLRGYQVACGGNGRGGIGYADGILYINGQCSGIYLFRGEELVGFEEQNRNNPAHRQTEILMASACPTSDGGYDYYYNSVSGQISRAKPGQALETVVQLPVKDSVAEYLAMGMLMLMTAFVVWLRIEDGEVPVVSQILQERKRRLR